MTSRDALQLVLFVGILLLITKPMGIYLYQVFSGEKNWFTRLFSPIETRLYRLCSVNPNEEHTWTNYTVSVLVFSTIAFIPTFVILLLQKHLPFNPEHFQGMPFYLALNTAISFVTNTNWQTYSGESTLSYFSQMSALTLQNFLSAAVGMAVAVAVIRGITNKKSEYIGNFFVDLVRGVLYVLLPMSIITAIFLVSQGIIQNFDSYREVVTLEGAKQLIPMGPVASQVAIKMLGTNGGGFFNANAAHPFENPTALSNFVQMLLIFILPSGLIYLLGLMANSRRHAWTLWCSVTVLFLAGAIATASLEQKGNPLFKAVGCESSYNMEGKETRFGTFSSSLFAVITTDASCGAVNSAHSSFTPLSGMILMVNMLLGEIIFGGVGAGLYGLIIFILLTVFIAGLMVGRTPEYLGKKIETYEIRWTMFAIIIMAFCILGFAAWAVLDPRGLEALSTTGPHGLSEALYAYTSATANNGSAFAGLSASKPFWTYTTAIAMLIGRFAVITALLAVAGSLSTKKIHPPGAGTFATEGVLFGGLLIAVMILVGALTFFPALTLGPVIEHFNLY